MSASTPISSDPAEDIIDSVVFLPIASSLVRQLAEVSSPTSSLTSDTDQLDNNLEKRRYSDVSQEMEDIMPDTASMVLRWNSRVHHFDARRGTSNLSRNLDRHVPLHTFNRHPHSTTTRISGSRLIRRGSEPLHSTIHNSRLSPPAYNRIQSSIPEPKRYDFPRPTSDLNSDFCSTPYFPNPQPAKPQAIRPQAPIENQKGKISAFLKFLSGKRPKRARRRKDALSANASVLSATETREHVGSRLELRHRLRRSERVSTTALDAKSGPVGSMSTTAETRTTMRGHGRRVSSTSKFSRYGSADCPSEALSMPLPGVSFQQGSRKRVSEPNVAKRNRVAFVTEGSSISSCSDRDEDNLNAKLDAMHVSHKPKDALKKMQEKYS